VLVEGETGSGKELVARGLHSQSRRQGRFCAINCAALTDELFESEMFGHVRGAFTGALTERRGLFEEADRGTLFLDEIGDLSVRGQAKLLRAIQEGEVRRTGENLSRRVDVRIIAATNRPLHEEVRQGRFRQDLLYRLDVIHIDIPPLRERREDIPLLAQAFWTEAARQVGSHATLAPATLAGLHRHTWPGNVRELQNTLGRLAVVAPRRGRIRPLRLPQTLEGAGPPVRLLEARRSLDRELVTAALARTGGKVGTAARELGITRHGLRKLMVRLGLDGSPPHR
jgi:DNA-binding NtrC family response regulator